MISILIGQTGKILNEMDQDVEDFKPNKNIIDYEILSKMYTAICIIYLIDVYRWR